MNLFNIFYFNLKSLGELSFLFFRRLFNVWIQPFVRHDSFYANKFQEYWWISHLPFPLLCSYRVVYFLVAATVKGASSTGVGQLQLEVQKQILHETVAHFDN